MNADSRRMQAVVLSVIAALLIALCVVVMIGIDRNRATLLGALGIAAVPAPDPALANRKLKPPDLQLLFGDSDNYPDEARDLGQQGAVAARLTVAPNGTVENCVVSDSSGIASLDAATCRIARDRARFTPARNAAGEAVSSSFVLRVRWQLPDA